MTLFLKLKPGSEDSLLSTLYNVEAMDSKEISKSKHSDGMKGPVRLTELPPKALKKYKWRVNMTNSNEHDQHSNGFPRSVHEPFGFLTPKKLGFPTDKYKGWHKTRSSDHHDLSSLKVGGHGFSRRVPSLQQDVLSGSKSLVEGQEKSNVVIKLPTSFSDSSSENSRDFKHPSLPNISVSKELLPKSKAFGAKEASKLATNLNLIDGRKKIRSFRGAKNPEKSLYAAGSDLDKISRIHLDNQLSLPKITIEEVLKSWEVQPSRGWTKKRSTSNAFMKRDPMEFLTQNQAALHKDTLGVDFSSCYEEVKGCRYLRIGKKEEEEDIYHRRNCPCNSCEHGEALKESPYLNA